MVTEKKKLMNRWLFHHIISTILVLFVLTLVVVGQKTAEPFCEMIEGQVVKPMKPLKVRSSSYSDECVFRIDWANNDRAKVWIEKHKTKEEANKSLTESRDAFTAFDDSEVPPRHRSVQINHDHFWDAAFSYASHYPDNFILLQKGLIEITMISNSHKILAEIENRLRTVKYDE